MEFQQILLLEDDDLRSHILLAMISIIIACYTIYFSVSNLEKKKTCDLFSGLLLARCSLTMNMCIVRFIQKHTSRVIVPQVFSFFTLEYRKGRPSGMKETSELITKSIQLCAISEYH